MKSFFEAWFTHMGFFGGFTSVLEVVTPHNSLILNSSNLQVISRIYIVKRTIILAEVHANALDRQSLPKFSLNFIFMALFRPDIWWVGKEGAEICGTDVAVQLFTLSRCYNIGIASRVPAAL